MNELDIAGTATAETGAISAVDELNLAATFTPQASPAHGSLWNDTRPRLSIAGAQITAYVDREGLLVVSIDTEAGRLQLGEDCHDIALRVLLDDVVLHEPSYAGHCWCTYRRDDDGALQLLHRAEDCGGPHPDQDTPNPGADHRSSRMGPGLPVEGRPRGARRHVRRADPARRRQALRRRPPPARPRRTAG